MRLANTVYIASWGRSGSTALASCLGAPKGAVAVGELQYLWDRGYDESTLCACMKPVLVCGFWAPLLERTAELLGHDVSELPSLASQAPKLRQLGGLLRDPQKLWRDHGDYLSLRRALHISLSEAGYDTVVDSSKRPVDLLALAHIPEIAEKLTAVHLARHPASTATSWSKAKPDETRREGALNEIGPWKALAWWQWWNRMTDRTLGHLQGPSLRVRWEDFTANPEHTLALLLGPERLAEIQLGPSEFAVQPSHQIGGNPVRLKDASGSITIRPDSSEPKMGALERLALRGQMLRFGYR